MDFCTRIRCEHQRSRCGVCGYEDCERVIAVECPRCEAAANKALPKARAQQQREVWGEVELVFYEGGSREAERGKVGQTRTHGGRHAARRSR